MFTKVPSVSSILGNNSRHNLLNFSPYFFFINFKSVFIDIPPSKVMNIISQFKNNDSPKKNYHYLYSEDFQPIFVNPYIYQKVFLKHQQV